MCAFHVACPDIYYCIVYVWQNVNYLETKTLKNYCNFDSRHIFQENTIHLVNKCIKIKAFV